VSSPGESRFAHPTASRSTSSRSRRACGAVGGHPARRPSAQPAERPMAAGERLPSWRRALGQNQLDDRSVGRTDREPSSPIPLVGDLIDRCGLHGSPREMHGANLRARLLSLVACAERSWNRTLAAALDLQRDLEALRPETPTHAPSRRPCSLASSSAIPAQLKTIVDVIRVVCANAESDLATLIAPHWGGHAKRRRSLPTSSRRQARSRSRTKPSTCDSRPPRIAPNRRHSAPLHCHQHARARPAQ